MLLVNENKLEAYDRDELDTNWFHVHLYYFNNHRKLTDSLVIRQENELETMIFGFHGIHDAKRSFVGSSGIYMLSYAFASKRNQERFLAAFKKKMNQYEGWSVESNIGDSDDTIENQLEFFDNDHYGLQTSNRMLFI